VDKSVIEYQQPADSNAKQVRGRPFKAGECANPKGRPKGSRNKINQVTLDMVQAEIEQNGAEALKAFRMRDPGGFWKMVFQTLQPKKVENLIEANISVFDDFNLQDRAEFAKAYQLARQMIGVEDALVIDAEPVKESSND
jgi:hypothetical protein